MITYKVTEDAGESVFAGESIDINTVGIKPIENLYASVASSKCATVSKGRVGRNDLPQSKGSCVWQTAFNVFA